MSHPDGDRHAGRVRFTEDELTVALTAAAKTVLAGKRLRRRAADADAAWDAMDRYQRFKLLDAVGDQVLPVLVALPDVEVAPGTRPTYSTRQVEEVVAGIVGDDLGKLRRAVAVKARTALVQTALANLPPRLDPDALGPPEHHH